MTKKAYWKDLGDSKHNAANLLYEELKRNPHTATALQHQAPPAVGNAGPVVGTAPNISGSHSSSSAPDTGNVSTVTPPAPVAPASTDDKLCNDLEIPSIERLEIDAEALVINENTLRNMPAELDPAQSLIMGVVLTVDEKQLKARLDQLQGRTSPFPLRSNFEPATTDIFTNRFEVQINPGVTPHEFRILGIPDGLSRKAKKMFVDTAIEKSVVLNRNQDHFSTDYDKTIITWKDIRSELDADTDWNRSADGWHLVNVLDGEQRKCSLYLTYVRTIDTDKLQRYVKSDPGDTRWNPLSWYSYTGDDSLNKNTVISALNIVVSKCFGGGVFRLGANKFFVEAGNHPLGDSPLCTIRGYFYSIRPGMEHILLNVNACTSAFLRPLRLDELMSKKHIFGKDWPSMLNGVKVYIDYSRGRTKKAEASGLNHDESRIKKICALGKSCNEQSFRLMRRDDKGTVTGEEDITVAEYLRQNKPQPLCFQPIDLPLTTSSVQHQSGELRFASCQSG